MHFTVCQFNCWTVYKLIYSAKLESATVLDICMVYLKIKSKITITLVLLLLEDYCWRFSDFVVGVVHTIHAVVIIIQL